MGLKLVSGGLCFVNLINSELQFGPFNFFSQPFFANTQNMKRFSQVCFVSLNWFSVLNKLLVLNKRTFTEASHFVFLALGSKLKSTLTPLLNSSKLQIINFSHSTASSSKSLRFFTIKISLMTSSLNKAEKRYMPISDKASRFSFAFAITRQASHSLDKVISKFHGFTVFVSSLQNGLVSHQRVSVHHSVFELLRVSSQLWFLRVSSNPLYSKALTNIVISFWSIVLMIALQNFGLLHEEKLSVFS